MKNIRILFSVFVVGVVMLISNTAYATKWFVNVQNYSFSPSNLPNVTVGDTVRWVWINGSHTTTSTTIPAGAASWDHPINSSNTFYEYHVTIAGSYNYKCTPHQGMGMVGSFTATALTPILVSISPNQALQGDSFLATITGSNTNFNGSPAVSLSFSGNPGEIINATSVTVISPTVIHAQFTIPVSASVGLWNVHVNTLVLPNGFTVIEVIPAITFMSPNFAHQGDSFNGTVFGQNTSWTGTPSVYLSYSVNPSEIINGSNVVVTSNTELTADFDIPYVATPGLWDLHVDALILQNSFTVIDVIPYLVGINPDSANQGEQVTSLITAVDSRFTLSSPSVSLSFTGNPSEVIDASIVNVLNDSQLEAVFNIPADASAGSWDVHVDDMVLIEGFTVNLLSGIGDPLETLVQTFPNPASHLFFIENAAGADVTVFNTMGKNIVAQKITSEMQAIDISQLSPGIYIVRIMMNGNDRVEKLLVN